MSDITPSKDEVNAARSGIYIQLKSTTNLIEIYGSLSNAIEVLNLYDFIENQVQVIASSRAWVRVTELRLNKLNRSEERLNNGG